MDQKEAVKKYNATYYSTHKETLRKKEPCKVCGKHINRTNMSTHLKTKMCKVLANTKQTDELTARIQALELLVKH